MGYAPAYNSPSYWPPGWGGGAAVVVPPADDRRDLLQWSLTALAGRLKAVASKSVTYARGADLVDLHATYGRKLLKLQDDDGIRMEWTDMDFVIPAADLVIDGALIEPRRGDRIFIAAGERIQSYEVAPYGTEPCWRYTDPYQLMIRIHTKLVEEA